MPLDLAPTQDLLAELTDADRQRILAAGWRPGGSWRTRMPFDPAVLEHVPADDRELLKRLDRGAVSEVWIAPDGRTLLEVELYRHDLAWQLLSLLEDGTLVRTAVHSARDHAGKGRLPSPRSAGYDRETLVDRPLDALELRHEERLRAIATRRRSAPVALRPEDHPALTRRVGEIVDDVTGRAANLVVLPLLVGPPLLASLPVPVAWALGLDLGQACVAASVLLVAWGVGVFGPGAQRLAHTGVVLVAPHLAGERVPAQRLLRR